MSEAIEQQIERLKAVHAELVKALTAYARDDEDPVNRKTLTCASDAYQSAYRELIGMIIQLKSNPDVFRQN
jgi:hypothetical protein